jgi:hypothetical protein
MPSDARVIEYQRDAETAPANTGAKQDTRFKSGASGNPNGRPRGSRSKLSEDFLQDLHEAWQEHGKQALKTCATREPTQFAKIVANILPRQTIEAVFSINADVDVSNLEDAKAFLAAYRFIREDAAPTKTIEHIEEGAVITGWRSIDD